MSDADWSWDVATKWLQGKLWKSEAAIISDLSKLLRETQDNAQKEAATKFCDDADCGAVGVCHAELNGRDRCPVMRKVKP